VQSPLPGNGASLSIPVSGQPTALEFVVFDSSGRWFNPQQGGSRASWRFECAGADGSGAPQPAAAKVVAPAPIAIAAPPPVQPDLLRMTADARREPGTCTHESEVRLGNYVRSMLRVTATASVITMSMVVQTESSVTPAFVHWAVSDGPGTSWRAPPSGWTTTPPRSSDGTGGAWNTDLDALGNGIYAVSIRVPAEARVRGIVCVLAMANGEWVKTATGDVFVPFPTPDAQPCDTPAAVPKDMPKAHVSALKVDSATPPWDETTASLTLPPAVLTPVVRAPRSLDTLRTDAGGLGTAGAATACDERMVAAASDGEASAHKSLMHRFKLAAELLSRAQSDGEASMVALFSWLRYFSTRQLVWNKNYNVKPREISAAQNALSAALCTLHRTRPELRDVVRLSMACIGRGGTGDMGQRIRDEILDIQRATGQMGGMMEEWHQKLHNNTSPDDVVICEALLAYLATPVLDVSVYWARLAQENITKERLLSYDRPIHSEPRFPADKRDVLIKNLREYLRTLKAVHSGADLASAADAVMGYRQASSQGVAIHNPPLNGVATPLLRQLLTTAQSASAVAVASASSGGGSASGNAASMRALILACEAIVEARHELRPWTKPMGAAAPGGRDADVLFLDQGLETALRTAVEGTLSAVSTAPAADVLTVAGLALENLTLSAGSNAELVLCLKEWRAVERAARGESDTNASSAQSMWPLRAKAVADRLRLSLSTLSERYTLTLAAPAAALGSRLGVDPHTVALFPEEVVRATPAAPLAQLLRLLEPRLRELANLGAWQVISSAEVTGKLVVVPTLGEVASTRFDTPTVLLTSHVSGDEDIAAGVVGVLTPSAPDVLSHSAVRARNQGVLFATVYDNALFTRLKAMQGQTVKCTPSQDGSDVSVNAKEAAAGSAATRGAGKPQQGGSAPIARIVPRPFKGRYAVSSQAFTAETVGAKSRNLSGLRGVALPPGVRLPAGAALTFGSFDQALNDGCNSRVKGELHKLLAELKRLKIDDPSHETVLQSIRDTVCRMSAPAQLRSSLAEALTAEGIPVPGQPGGYGTWDEAWRAITRVWASKWNARSVTSCSKAGLNHSDVAMAVLVQEQVPSRLSFVVHTSNPVNGRSDQLYGELVCGLGDTLVGAFPGRALSFSVDKQQGGSGVGDPTLLGFPSKPMGLFNTTRTLIFRSDSNGEDLEGFAGAGLYDSFAMHQPVEQAIDYGTEDIMCDAAFRTALLQRIALASVAAEQALGGPQDIEGCVTADAEVVIVQTRPQV